MTTRNAVAAGLLHQNCPEEIGRWWWRRGSHQGGVAFGTG